MGETSCSQEVIGIEEQKAIRFYKRRFTFYSFHRINMVDKIVSGLLVIVGIINILPIMVFFDSSKTIKLYGFPLEGENLTILMRHRGVLLSLVGIALITAAVRSEFIVFAVCLALISKFTFIFLTFTAENYSAEIQKVALIDVGSIVLLLIALGLHFYNK